MSHPEGSIRRVAIETAQKASRDLCKLLEGYPDPPTDDPEREVEQIWSNLIEMAICTPADEPAQDRLVAEVVHAGELRSVVQDGMTADGNSRSELPFMVEVLTATWELRLEELTTHSRQNLAAFTARLVAADERASRLGYCAVLVLREALETPIPLRPTRNHKEGDMSIAELLPAVVAWFKFAGHRLAIFSGGKGYAPLTGEQGELTSAGQSARRVGGLQPGFSTKRWRFWYMILRELSFVDDIEVRELAEQGVDSMDLWNDWIA